MLVFAVHHSCADFVSDVLATCVEKCATMSYENLGKERTVDFACWYSLCFTRVQTLSSLLLQPSILVSSLLLQSSILEKVAFTCWCSLCFTRVQTLSSLLLQPSILVCWCLLCIPRVRTLSVCCCSHASQTPLHRSSGRLSHLHKKCATTSYKGLGKECIGTLRKWTLCAQELRAQVDPDPPVEHCAKF